MKLTSSSESPTTSTSIWRTLFSSRARQVNTRSYPLAATRKRLVWMNMLVVSGILAIMALAVYGWESHASDLQVNQQLVQSVTPELQSDLLVSATQDSPPEARDADLAEQYEPSSPNVFSIGLNPSGHVVFDPGNARAVGLPDLAAAWPVLRGQQPSTLVTIGDDTKAYRLYTIPVKSHGHIIGAIQVGQSLASRERQLQDLRIILAGVGAGVLLLTWLASLYLARRALRPLQLAYERQHQFAAAASHELRTPLAIVRSQGELVERALHWATANNATVDVRERLQVTEGDVQDILAEVDYMARLVRDLVVLARDQGDQRSIANDVVDLHALVVETVGKMTPQAAQQNLALQLEERAGELPLTVRGDRDRLRQLILVLLENALRFTPAGGQIFVSLSLGNERRFLVGHRQTAQLTITDTGKGIAPDALPHIFEPFYRVPAAATPEDPETQGAHSGAGLGLALAHWIITAHGGEITATSELGVGTRFTVSLPVANPAPQD
jgi:signal transduction histidine kinase